ncbi:hypothetical protein TNCV_4813311 [Trichonephila clavipes]|nr:hypothetical protein TNCV_4813311 [Trichonephila clavipes]
MVEAVREAADENDGKRDLAVNGSWEKQGFSSKNGLVTVTSVDTETDNSRHSALDQRVLLPQDQWYKRIDADTLSYQNSPFRLLVPLFQESCTKSGVHLIN